MFEISKDFTFSASHQLTHLYKAGLNKHLHGHNYVVRITLRGEIDENGLVFDWHRLGCFQTLIYDIFDHRHLNIVMATQLGLPTGDAGRYTTPEHLAQYFYGWLIQRISDLPLYSIGVSETPDTWVTFIQNHNSASK